MEKWGGAGWVKWMAGGWSIDGPVVVSHTALLCDSLISNPKATSGTKASEVRRGEHSRSVGAGRVIGDDPYRCIAPLPRRLRGGMM